MPHNVGDIVQLTFFQNSAAQVVLNVLHYRVISGTSSASDIADNASLASYVAAQRGPGLWITQWMTICGSSHSMVKVRAQKIEPIRSTFADAVAGAAGAVAGGLEHTNVAFVITKRGQTGTRRAIGSMHLGGLPSEMFDEGFRGPTLEAWWTNNGHFWSDSLTVPANNVTYKPCIYNRGAIPNSQDISSWDQQMTARVMRRRTVGLGI